MSPPSPRPAAYGSSRSLRALLGIGQGDQAAEWPRLRDAQLRSASRSAPFLLALHLAAGMLAVAWLAPLRPATQLIGWFASVAFVGTWRAARRRAAAMPAGTATPSDALRRTFVEGPLIAAPWTIAACIFIADPAHRASPALWMVLATLLTADVLAMASTLLSSLLFVGCVTLPAAALLVLRGETAAATAALIFAFMVAAVAVLRAATLLRLHAVRAALAERQETVSLLLGEQGEDGAAWLWQTDASRRIVAPSARLCAASGRAAADLDNMPFLQMVAGPSWETGDVAPALRDLADRMRRRESFRQFVLPVTVGAQTRWWEIAAAPRHDAAGVFLGYGGVGVDVTEQRESTERIRRMARFDALTGLPNRLHLNETLSQAMAEAEARGSRCAFMMIDLDKFKAVNDTLGHPVGDRLLRRVAERLARLAGPGHVAGRLGGDEFAVVICDATDADRLERLARRVIEAVSRPYEVDQHRLVIGASVGVATSPRDGRTADMLVRAADLALYRSKNSGGGVFHAYDPRLTARAEERRTMELALGEALENGELHLLYQPVVDAVDGRLRTLEALLRWNHPRFGVVPPAQFVPIAEEARLIAPIGEWVLRTACREAAGWPDPVAVAVNVSADQLGHAGFATVVASALAQSGLAPHRLELEVTENVFLRGGDNALRVLEQVLDLGVRLSLDDFGTGNSSLNHIGRARLSSIKIDRSSVVAAADGAADAMAVISAVVAFGGSLGMAVTAEGVETPRQATAVRRLGCGRLQGYLIDEPMPASEASALAWRSAGITHAA